ncbi:MAG TPA: hypothetical protein VJS68_01010, partial [Thermoplasmata archaeon]|nr:hypothetical protein [Thermoplasmata archaeon]
MPGAPNRPPEMEPTAAPAPPKEEPSRRVLRRLAPALVALRLPAWKGAPAAELLTPFQQARAAYDSGQFSKAEEHLDQLSRRFAEPRWPSIPEPFKLLRISIPFPQPPHWDPDFGVPPAEKESRVARRRAELQARLVEASVEVEAKAGSPVDDLRPLAGAAKAALGPSGVPEEFYPQVDAVWE